MVWVKSMRRRAFGWLLMLSISALPGSGWSWHDETHLAIARAAGYSKWYNAAGADITKIKAGDVEVKNHYVGNPPETVVSAQMVLDQVVRYNDSHDEKGHLYGAIIAAIREYQLAPRKGKYAQYHLAFCAHYAGDLSQPLHNLHYNDYNQRYHTATDGIIENEVLNNLPLIRIYSITIRSEADLAAQIAKIANLSMKLGGQLEKEGRLMTRQEAYRQISHSASLLKAILEFIER